MISKTLSSVLCVAFGLSACGGRDPALAADPKASEFQVVLEDAGEQKITAIKLVREVTGLGLRDAKDLVDHVPSVVQDHLAAQDAKALAARLEGAGMRAAVRPR